MNRRTSIEQVFSRLKSRDLHDMSRGFVRVTGLARVTLAVGLLAVAHNIQALETFAERHGNDSAPDHELMAPRDTFVVLHLNDDEAAEFAAYRADKRKKDRNQPQVARVA